jgi:hypothetical protein
MTSQGWADLLLQISGLSPSFMSFKVRITQTDISTNKHVRKLLNSGAMQKLVITEIKSENLMSRKER